jgi:predicted DNA-binding WGR domain protein
MASATSDNDDGTTISFGCDYAKSSIAKCHGKSCENEISKGTLRLSRLIPNPFIPQSSTREEQLMPVYYHVDCFINYLRSGKENKKRVENVENDLQGFNDLKKADQNKLKKLFGYEEKLQENLSETSTSANTTYLEHNQDKKYWQISIDNKSTKTKYGLLDEPDSKAIILYKDFSIQSEAQKYVDKKIQEKLKYGYTVKKQTGDGTNKQTTEGTTRKRKQPTTSAKPTPAKRAKQQGTKSTNKTVGTRKQPARSASKSAK